MTIDFVDVMIVDRDTIGLSAGDISRLALVDPAGCRGDGVAIVIGVAAGPIPREPYARALPDSRYRAAALVALSLLWPTDLNEDFDGQKLCFEICADGRRGDP